VTSFATIWKTSRLLNALPADVSMLLPTLIDGGTAKQHNKRSIREVSWLEENGQCMDNIKVGLSGNPDAGRGAFANRFIPEGGLVAPAPLIHIPDLDVLTMYAPQNSLNEDGVPLRDLKGPVTSQLLLNYCFGHQESTLLLCPYGYLTAFINHSAKNPNTKIQWSKEMRHPIWRRDPIKEWGDQLHAGLSFDFVALRDIEEDEEILIDYGEAWEEAWQAHVRSFVPRENYTPAYELNEMTDSAYRTEEEEPFEGVSLWCNSFYTRQFIFPKILADHIEYSECRILKRLREDRYMAQVIRYKGYVDVGMSVLEREEVLWDVPSDAFFFRDLPNSRDHLKFGAFRHAMGVPDETFPDIWKTAVELGDFIPDL
jgi:hypothetical protein